MPKKKLTEKEEKRIEREISLLKNSQELNKYDNNIQASSIISLMILIAGFILGSFLANYFEGALAGFIGLIIIVIVSIILSTTNLKKFNDKNDLIKSKYELLGVDYDKLNKELDEINKKVTLRKPHELREWKKIAIAFTVGALFGTVVWVWLVP